MAIMITGGTGFIGAHLARRLLQAGETVVLFDAQPDRQAIQDIPERVTVVRGDATVLQDLLHGTCLVQRCTPPFLRLTLTAGSMIFATYTRGHM